MRQLVSILALLCAGPVASLFAQQLPPIERGARVRVTAPSLGMNREAARFQTVADDMLVVVADSTMNCPLGSVWRLDLHRGRKGNVGRGALFGGLIGAALGLGAGVSMQVEDFNAGAFTAAGALAGVLIGVPVGAFIKTDRWEEVPLDQLRVQPVATPGGGLGLAASLEF